MPARTKFLQMLRVAALPLIVVTAALIAWKLGYFELDRRREVAAFVERTRDLPVIQLLYIAVYALIAVICLPAVIVTILGGAFFGPVWGAFLAWTGVIVGTALTHTLAARVAKAPLRRLFGEHRLLRQLKNDVGIAGLFRLRVIPVAPLGVFAYVAGIAGVSLTRLLLASAIGLLPSVVAYAYVGAQLMRGLADPDAADRALQVAGLVTLAMLTVSIVPVVVRWIGGGEREQ